MRIGKGSKLLTVTTTIPGQLVPLVLPVEVAEVEAVVEVMVEGPVQGSTEVIEVVEEAVVAVVAVVAEVEEVAEAMDSSLIPEIQAGIIHPMSGTDCLPTNRGRQEMQGPNIRNNKVISWPHMLPKLELLPMLKDKLLQEAKQTMMLAPMFNSRLLAPINSQVNKLCCHHHRPTLCPQQELESVPP